MARRGGKFSYLYEAIGLAIVILVITYFFRLVSWVMKPRYRSNFADLGSASTCVQGLKPCQEGYFCQQESCVPISPPFNTANITGYVQGVDL